MKKILIITILFLSATQAKPCMTDIYFGNGIWSKNKQEQLRSKRALRNIVNLDKAQEGKTYNYKLAYNPGNGLTNDLIETYWQLRESGQITDGYFMATYIALSGQYTANAFVNKLLDIVTNYNEEVSTMHKTLQNASFNQKHNVLFVGHSQGNLFGNKMYSLLTDKEKKKFRMVSVGTVADKVAGNGPYVNIANDYVVNSIPNSLKGNFDGRGHDFQGVYLNIDSMRRFYDEGSVNAGAQIAIDVKSTYDNLQRTATCSVYNQVFLTMHKLDYVELIGNIAGTNLTESIGSVSLSQYAPPILVEPEYGEKYYICSYSQYIYGSSVDLFYGGSDFDSPTAATHIAFYSLQDIESFKGKSYVVAKVSNGAISSCTNLSFSGELYNAIEDVFK